VILGKHHPNHNLQQRRRHHHPATASITTSEHQNQKPNQSKPKNKRVTPKLETKPSKLENRTWLAGEMSLSRRRRGNVTVEPENNHHLNSRNPSNQKNNP
jgi:hypothetical protein